MQFDWIAPLARRALFLPLLLLAIMSTAGTTPSTTAVSAAKQLDFARQAEFNGEWEVAEGHYQTAMQVGGETGQTARLELARMYERWERYSNALDTLRPLTDGPNAGCRLAAGGCARAWFQQGSVLQALGRGAEARAAYDRSISAGSPAAAYARLESGKLQIIEGDPTTGLGTLAPLLGGAGPEYARRAALRTAAPVAEELGGEGVAQALELYRSHAALATSITERVPSLWKVGELSRTLGDVGAAARAYAELVTRYPGTQEAESALQELTALGRPAGALESAIVHYRRRNNDSARTLFNQVLGSGAAAPERAVALFYLGALAERRSDHDLAIENYTESYEADPAGPLADEALWWRAEIYEEIDRPDDAQRLYALIVERNTNFARGAEAAFRAGNISYKAGRTDDARRRWAASMQARRNDVASTSAFWAGRAAADLGDQTAARNAYQEAVRRDPSGYYGLRAAAMLAGDPRAPRSAPDVLRVPTLDWTAAEAWLAGWAGPEDASLWAAFESSEDWRAAWELAEAGWSQIALEAFLQIVGRRADQPWIQYRAGRMLGEKGFPRAAFSAGFSITNRAPADSAIPAAILRMRYPAPWPDLVQRYADQRGVDPLLIYAMMRQESAFDPRAGSSAGAFGLTQFIAGTATDVARSLGRDVRFQDLARPVLAIEFGAFYLSTRIREFDGSVYEGLAAYNGGATNAARWRRGAGDPPDVDRFLETIDFSETESYIRLVLENYAWYRHLYGGAPAPSIVR
jgi:soluble lytic murein transglycosylase